MNMKYFSYRAINNNEEIFVENMAISYLAKSVATPFYCYSKKTLVENFENFDSSFKSNKISDYKICYAIKANCNINLVKILASLGAGIDAVSSGEIFRALKAGINPKKIVFAGVGKTYDEIKYALQNNVEEFSVESRAEMFLLNDIAKSLNKKAKFSLRVNPNVDAKTHYKISTGKKGDKFGVDIEEAEELYKIASKLEALEIYGISTHIGSQITSLEPFKIAFQKLRQLFLKLKNNGLNIQSLDFGGGIGIFYKDENIILINDYIKLIKEITTDLNVKIVIAPGRAIVGSAGFLVSKLTYVKETALKNFLIIDAGINDLMRPGLYGSYHEVLPVFKKNGLKAVYDFAGPVCESTDILAKDRLINNPQSGDLFVFCDAGAYGSSMSNEYNCRPLIPEILVDDNNFSIIRKRPTFEQMLKLEVEND